MKKIFKYLSILVLLVTTLSCSEEVQWKLPEVNLVPIYSLSNIVGNNASFEIQIFKEKALLIEFKDINLAKSYETVNYVDSSSENDIDLTFIKLENITIDGMVSTNKIKYTVKANKISGLGNLIIETPIGTNAYTTESYTLSVEEKMIYN